MTERSRTYLDLLGLAFVFLISRAAFYLAGVRFDASPIATHLQIVNPSLLTEHFWQTIFYLHNQPPLFNAYVGAVLILFPGHSLLVFQVCYWLMGASMAVFLHALMRALGVGRAISAVLVSLFMINPEVILYENYLSYSYPVAVLLVLCAFALQRYAAGPGRLKAVLFFTLAAILVLVRNTFHVVWYVGIMLGLVLLDRKRSKQIFLASVIPLLLICSVSLKNGLVSGMAPGTSVWFNYQVASMVMSNLTHEEAVSLVNGGNISLSTGLETLDVYKAGEAVHREGPLSPVGVRILDDYEKSSGVPNFNSRIMIKSAEKYLKDAKYVLANLPQVYFRGLVRAFTVYVFPGPTDISIANREKIAPYEDLYNFHFAHLNRINSKRLYTWYLWGWEEFNTIKWDGISLSLYLATAGAFIGLIFFGFRLLRTVAEIHGVGHPKFLTLMFVYGNIIYVTLISNCLSAFGNNRYRFAIDAFFVVLVGLALTKIRDLFRPSLK